MSRLFVVFVMIIAAHCAAAQNWQTVRHGDTAYFTAGRHYSYKSWVYYPKPALPMMDSPIMRMAYVAGVSASGTDSVFRFFTSLRDTSNGGSHECVDTAGASWLGPLCVRRADGTEFYFNSFGDTIVVQTRAAPGARWRLAKDTGGVLFIGSISQAGVMNIDGVPDSFKTISIQAYSAGLPAAHPYNALILQISKAHGWIQALDLYRFPNTIWNRDQKGLVIDSTQHIRMPASSIKGRTEQNIDWKYLPGNEWVWLWEGGFSYNPGSSPQNVTVRHDSVLSFVPLSAGVGLATMRSVEFRKSRIYASGVTITVHTDTVRDIVRNPVPVNVEHNWRHSAHHRYFAWPYDTIRYFFTSAVLAHIERAPNFYNGCIRYLPFSAIGDWDHFDTYLTDFGQTGKYVVDMDAHSGQIRKAEYGRYIYIKTGGTSFGTKINVATLAAGTPPNQPAAFSIHPNPASRQLTVSSSFPVFGASAALRKITGQIVFSAAFPGDELGIPTEQLPAGLYFLELTGKEFRQSYKVTIQH